MATTTRLRRDLTLVANLATGELDTLWARVETTRQAEAALRDVVPGLIQTYGAAAATVGAEWYDDARDEASVSGTFRADVATPRDSDPQRMVSWALGESQDLPAFQTLIVGGVQRRILNHSRTTISTASVADPSSRGWKRVGVGECEFCAMLIGRGAVYTEATARFHAHDHCKCSPAPAWA